MFSWWLYFLGEISYRLYGLFTVRSVTETLSLIGVIFCCYTNIATNYVINITAITFGLLHELRHARNVRSNYNVHTARKGPLCHMQQRGPGSAFASAESDQHPSARLQNQWIVWKFSTDRKGPYQTGRIRMLILIFAGCIRHNAILRCASY